jgi:hypothetical protein
MAEHSGRLKQYQAVLSTPYPIPNDGTVGRLLKIRNRHVFRPAHLNKMFVESSTDSAVVCSELLTGGNSILPASMEQLASASSFLPPDWLNGR